MRYQCEGMKFNDTGEAAGFALCALRGKGVKPAECFTDSDDVALQLAHSGHVTVWDENKEVFVSVKRI